MARTKGEVLEICLLDFFPWSSQPASYELQDHAQEVALVFPYRLLIKKVLPQDYLKVRILGVNSVVAPSF